MFKFSIDDKSQPLRLKDAAQIYSPDGAIKVSTLRAEIRKGNLTARMIGNKLFVTINDLERMSENCRVILNPHDCGFDQSAKRTESLSRQQHGSSLMGGSKSQLEQTHLILDTLIASSKSTLRKKDFQKNVGKP